MQNLIEQLRYPSLCGVQGATAAIDACAAQRSDLLDLQQLRLTNEQLDELAPKLREVASHVTKLNLFLNEITHISASLGVLSNVTELLAGANPLIDVSPDLLRCMPSLEVLDIGFSDSLTTLPDAFDATPKLRVLRAGNNLIEQVPATLYTCANLDELQLYGNCLKTLHSDIGKLTRLRLLNVGRNQLSQLPATLAECRNLQCLRVYENCISSLPPGISDIATLTELGVAGNQSLPPLPLHVRSAACAKTTAAFLTKA